MYAEDLHCLLLITTQRYQNIFNYYLVLELGEDTGFPVASIS